MAPRDPALPEGTDHIVNGAGETGVRSPASPVTESSSPPASRQGGFVASGSGNDKGENTSSSSSAAIREKLKEQAVQLRDQAGEKLRGIANDGKTRTTGVLDDLRDVIEDAAKSIDQRLGPDYGEYAHKAARYVSEWNGKLREKSVDDLLEDTRSAVKASPGIAIAAAAIAGFALVRIMRTGLEETGSRDTVQGSDR